MGKRSLHDLESGFLGKTLSKSLKMMAGFR